ncbi:hypothetical protein Skr01_26370 [Sphaerisporangium krabiense]|uniref:Uncharacterized protein n=1 Tax=Sphaerisporangium krabiense TaxID=763782 RepID=A0A7W8ZAI8_9ACTN|nr:hypothetical protein [Sphaerisporangium krabiense]MBB5630494.1 hypothetical protein [Sphaerisporangium krabiense]GII62552.1 hypothetical protein Skr01_26370 [Sphaerisporangium krabiense]
MTGERRWRGLGPCVARKPPVNEPGGPVRRLCIALDAHGHGAAGRPLVPIVEDASERAGLDRLYLAERGAPAGPRRSGGLLLLLPPGVDEARVIAGFVGELRLALRRHNDRPGEDARTRVRAAFHQGPTRVGEGGVVGRAVDTVCMMRDSDALKDALRRHPGSDLAVAISAQLFEDVIEHEQRDLRRHAFHPLTIKAQGAPAEAWISVPGADRHVFRRDRLLGVPRRRRARPGPVVNIDEF